MNMAESQVQNHLAGHNPEQQHFRQYTLPMQAFAQPEENFI